MTTCLDKSADVRMAALRSLPQTDDFQVPATSRRSHADEQRGGSR